MIADAPNGMVAIDLETAPNQSEVKRLAALRVQLAEAKGRLKAATKLKQPLDALQAEIKRLGTAIDYAEKAGLDPHRARPRLFQLYGGGTHAAVIDLDRTGSASLSASRISASSPTTRPSNCRSWRRPASRRAKFIVPFRRPALTGENKPTLIAAQQFLGIILDKDLQTATGTLRTFRRNSSLRGDGRGCLPRRLGARCSRSTSRRARTRSK